MHLRYLPVLLTVLLLAACGDSDISISTHSDTDTPGSLVEISAPISGSVLPADKPFSLEYAVLRSANGHHVSIQVDQKKPEKVNSLRGFHRMPGLPAGAHTLVIREHREDGSPTGSQAIIRVTMR